ncbi:MAG: YfhO family protein, partial [Pseudomonadota bacterium]
MTARDLLWIVPLAGLWLWLATVSSTGLLNTDETLYVLGTDAMAKGRLTVDNGFEALGPFEALVPYLIRIGPEGLAPQYPSGYFALAAPLFAALDIRALILINALAAAATLFVLHASARLFTDDRRLALHAVLILGLCGFVIEYVLGVWPHALSMLIVAVVVHLSARAVLGGTHPGRDAALAGLVLGLGLTVRVDVVLAGPPIALWVILFARRPLALAWPGLLGVLPGLVLAALLNEAKFGTFNPLSYGDASGSASSTNPSRHLWLIPAGLVGLGAAFALRLPMLSRRLPWLALAGVVALAGLALALPRVANILAGLGHGAEVLLFDLRESLDPREAIRRLDDGTVLFWGYLKKALGQSLPWLGVLVFVALHRHAARERAWIVLLGLLALFWMLPFLRMAWHGGAGNNLRYFLPLLPWLALLCAYGLRELSRLGARPFSVALWALVGLGALVVGVLIWHQQGIALAASLQQRLPQWLLLALALAGAATALVGRTRAAALASVTAGLTVTALILAGVLGNLFDLSQSQRVRTYYQAREAHFAPLPA